MFKGGVAHNLPVKSDVIKGASYTTAGDRIFNTYQHAKTSTRMWAKHARYKATQVPKYVKDHQLGVMGTGLYGMTAMSATKMRQEPKKPIYTKQTEKQHKQKYIKEIVASTAVGGTYGAMFGMNSKRGKAAQELYVASGALREPEASWAASEAKNQLEASMIIGASKGAIALGSIPAIAGKREREPTAQEWKVRHDRNEKNALARAIAAGKIGANEAEIKAWKTRRQKYGKSGRRN